MDKPKFFQSNFEIEYKDKTLSLGGLVSLTGITKIHLSLGLPEEWKSILGETIKVQLKFVHHPELLGVFLQRKEENRTFYEIKFRELAEQMREYLQVRLESEGESPKWQRKFPRIPVKSTDDPDLAVPSLCMIRKDDTEIFVNVLNFTLGGLRVETIEDNLADVKVGQMLTFDLVTSAGEVINNISAEVRNIAIDEGTNHKTGFLTRAFGLSFKPMTAENDKRYKSLIREYLNVLQKKNPPPQK